MVRERRKRTRVPVVFGMNVSVEGEETKATTCDISLNGVSFVSDRVFEEGSLCVIHLRLRDDVQMNINGKITRSRDDGTAAAFIDMDEETFFHLKKIVLNNAPNADDVEKELEKPAFY